MLTAQIHVDPRRLSEFKVELARCMDHARQEPGCISIAAQQLADDPSVFLMYEHWRSEAEFFDEVRLRPYFVHYRERTIPMHTRERVLDRWRRFHPPIEQEG